MIVSFRHKGLKELFASGRSAKIAAHLKARCLRILDALDQASKPADMNVPGYDFHALHGFTPTRYTVHVNGPWCITFEFEDDDAARVDFEQYH
ncbi:Endoribonuclease HigB [Methylobacterium cerastii]|uniref:Endoribonuclease HigB n=1 Tax=Methylobacterium cerastii TaxID=932741 RepID=A0ABQ4QCH4_9HYPH|nr:MULTISPECIES: type II toxin-antitoxin system RelE/ParE family toxin [Methylobacterium]TXN06858.1 plasmid maintenance system killer [Methylobacterium sp. WL122]TXM73169.1 plasmid maintenance system killer [Methylobacterium sp. WL12]TXN00603.1 plasmid maintenance system killer [Methylobacterium sp. WL103]TXN80703.1 plasmid maintenance system killer [Methylobacterium sp. WL8]GJD42520.1 Endoribonuclease HigB [Methylobacterium cerastii]